MCACVSAALVAVCGTQHVAAWLRRVIGTYADRCGDQLCCCAVSDMHSCAAERVLSDRWRAFPRVLGAWLAALRAPCPPCRCEAHNVSTCDEKEEDRARDSAANAQPLLQPQPNLQSSQLQAQSQLQSLSQPQPQQLWPASSSQQPQPQSGQPHSRAVRAAVAAAESHHI
jgi:hypothetical protein